MISCAKSFRKEYGVIRCGDIYIFTVASDVKESIKLCLFNLSGEDIAVLDISSYKLYGNIYSVEVSGLESYEGFQYEYICDGKKYLDPYMQRHSIKRKFGQEITKNDVNRAVFLKKTYAFDDALRLNISYSDTIAYQLHVRGFTAHPSSKVKGKGCFLGIIEKIDYLRELGINQVELMPVYDFYEIDYDTDKLLANHPKYITDKTLDENGNIVDNSPVQKINYWGYKKANYFCVKQEYSYSEDAPAEFRSMVKALHDAGIEVILQMYFNKSEKPGLICDALRFWYSEYHVDGFHIIGERLPLDLLLSDDYLSDAKLYINNIDKNNSIYADYSSCKNVFNVDSRFLVSARRYLKSDSDSLAPYVNANRYNPSTLKSLNYITCYEGMTLNDLVSYEYKHNEANGEDNSDGTDYNISWNCGVEGKSSKKHVKALRIRQIKNALCLLMLSQGAPMLFMGDEMLNSQEGNNNPYCQDNEISWLNWKLNKGSEEILAFTKMLIKYRREHRVLHQASELKNMDYLLTGSPDISYHQDMAWKANLNSNLLHIGIMLDGGYAKTQEITEDTLYIAYNMHWENHTFGLPKLKNNRRWELVFSSADNTEIKEIISDLGKAQDKICIYKRSVVVLKAGLPVVKEEK